VGALLKNEQDVTLFEKLVFMQRHNRWSARRSSVAAKTLVAWRPEGARGAGHGHPRRSDS